MSGPSASNPIVKISLEASGLNGLINEIVSFLKLDIDCNGLPSELLQRLVNLLETPEQLFRINAERSPTGGACEVVVCLKPSEGFLDFVSALRTWKRNSDIVVKHGSLPDGNSDAEAYHKSGLVNSN